MRSISAAVLLTTLVTSGMIGSVRADVLRRPPFVATLSNHAPLVFGMTPADAARVLRTPLTYVRGRHGNEIYLAVSDIGGSLFFQRRDYLHLQFRHSHLTGWKGDWNLNETWR
ncbi:MAG: hypothetical protein ACTHNN_07195 [Xanthobacteraceae bacterium]